MQNGTLVYLRQYGGSSESLPLNISRVSKEYLSTSEQQQLDLPISLD